MRTVRRLFYVDIVSAVAFVAMAFLSLSFFIDFIDQLGDKSALDKGHLLTSVVWNLVPVYSAMIEDLKAGRFGTHPYSIQLADGSVQLRRSRYISDSVWSDIEAQRALIVSGKLKVDPVWDAVTVRGMMTSVAAPPK